MSGITKKRKAKPPHETALRRLDREWETVHDRWWATRLGSQEACDAVREYVRRVVG